MNGGLDCEEILDKASALSREAIMEVRWLIACVASSYFSERCNASAAFILWRVEKSLIQMNGGLDCEEILAHLDEYPDEMILSVDEYENQILEKDPI